MLRALNLFTCAFALLSIVFGESVSAFEPCDSPIVSYGPYDYRTERDKLAIVERTHFTSDVETLRRGATSSTPAGDLNYTLLASPNHHRALMAMANYSIRVGKERVPDAAFTTPCYFERAIRFAPDDGIVRLVFAIYLNKVGKKPEMVDQLKAAEELSISGANNFYNMGLLFFEAGNYDKALEYAHKASQLGFQLPGLRRKLESVGKWKEASPTN